MQMAISLKKKVDLNEADAEQAKDDWWKERIDFKEQNESFFEHLN